MEKVNLALGGLALLGAAVLIGAWLLDSMERRRAERARRVARAVAEAACPDYVEPPEGRG